MGNVSTSSNSGNMQKQNIFNVDDLNKEIPSSDDKLTSIITGIKDIASLPIMQPILNNIGNLLALKAQEMAKNMKKQETDNDIVLFRD